MRVVPAQLPRSVLTLERSFRLFVEKTFWLAQWNRDNPNFKLDMNKANRWAKDYAKKKKAEKQMKEDSKLFLQD